MKLAGEIAAAMAVHDSYERFRRRPTMRVLPGPARRALFALAQWWADTRRRGEQ